MSSEPQSDEDEEKVSLDFALESKRITSTQEPIPATPLFTFFRWTWSPFFRTLFPIRYKGVERVPRKGGVIIAGNHLSHIDPLYIIAGIRRKIFHLAKDEHFNNLPKRIFFGGTGQIPTVREKGGGLALSRAIDVLDTGEVLGIYPEGTRSKRTESPFLGKGKTGVARIAASHPNSPVVPVAHQGTRSVMPPKQSKFPRLWRKVTVHYGEGVTWNEWMKRENGGRKIVSDISVDSLSPKEADELCHRLYRSFTDQLMASIKILGAP